ncbi:MAG: hypothetical protein JZD41_03380 [Thermoproteus sp.]|nr:hypothetical protein [Thermoproteus sp.]
MRIFISLFVAFALYIFASLGGLVRDPGAAARALALAFVASFGLILALLPVAGPLIYTRLLDAASVQLAVVPPQPLLLAAWWISWALTAASAVFLAMYFAQVKRYIAKRAFRFLLWW